MTGVIDRWGSGNEGQSYRYAPLSAGLDIVRSTLCKHELAVIQTTHVDRDTATVLLTTTLAHGSGEWICATWPVCRTTEMTNPKLMGASLTYARRYGLFTLVGIAGEDDLDAPEFLESSSHAAKGTAAAAPRSERAGLAQTASPERQAGLAGERPVSAEVQQAFRAAASAEGAQARLRPVARARTRRSDAGVPRASRAAPGSLELAQRDLNKIEDPDTLFAWALHILPFRNTLPDNERASLDAAFFEKAEAVDADPEVLIAFEQLSPKPNGLHPSPASSA
jgi:hypothetical protein